MGTRLVITYKGWEWQCRGRWISIRKGVVLVEVLNAPLTPLQPWSTFMHPSRLVPVILLTSVHVDPVGHQWLTPWWRNKCSLIPRRFPEVKTPLLDAVGATASRHATWNLLFRWHIEMMTSEEPTRDEERLFIYGLGTTHAISLLKLIKCGPNQSQSGRLFHYVNKSSRDSYIPGSRLLPIYKQNGSQDIQEI